MRKALRANPSRKPPTFTVQEPAPVKGWMAKESMAEAEEQSAVIMKNFFPEPDAIRSRRGSSAHATGLGAPVATLLRYISASLSKLFAVAGGGIYDVTGSGAVGAPAVSGLTDNYLQQVMFATPAGQFLIAVNGDNGVMSFDGAAWVNRSGSITPAGVSDNWVNVTVHKNRLWFVQEASTDLYYLDVDSVQGASHKFPTGSLWERGGYVMAIGTYSVDSGDGMDDMFVAITSEGECALWQGTDPSAASTWSLIGVYYVGDPLGRRCLFQVGGDLLMIVEDGILPMSQAMKVDKAVIGVKSITANIRKAYTDAVRRSREVQGWEIVAYPLYNLALCNAPAAGSWPTQQFVFNTTTGAWALYEGWNSLCWIEFDGRLYFGGTDGRVMQAAYGANDDGRPIHLELLTAFSHLKNPGRLKHVKDHRWYIATEVIDTTYDMAIAVDYDKPQVTAQAGRAGLGTGGWFTWDVTPWDGPAVWYGEQVARDWSGGANVGTVHAAYFSKYLDAGGAGAEFKFRLLAADYIYEPGGVL